MQIFLRIFALLLLFPSVAILAQAISRAPARLGTERRLRKHGGQAFMQRAGLALISIAGAVFSVYSPLLNMLDTAGVVEKPLLRPRGVKSLAGLKKRTDRAREKGFVRDRPVGHVHVLVPEQIQHETRALAKATSMTRSLELRAGLHRRNGNDLKAAVMQGGAISETDAQQYHSINKLGNIARHRN